MLAAIIQYPAYPNLYEKILGYFLYPKVMFPELFPDFIPD